MFDLKKIIKNKQIILLAITIIGIFSIMFLFNYLTPFFYDDYRYAYSFATGERIVSVSQIFESLQTHYYTMNGRLLLHFFAHLFCMLDGLIFDIVNAAAFVLMLILTYYLGTGTLKKIDYKLILVVFFAVWFTAPAFSESFLWLTGSVNYLFSIVFFLAALIPYRFFFKENAHRTVLQNFLLCICGLFCGLLGGYTNENISVTFIALQLMFWAIYLINGYKYRVWMLFEMLGNAVGTFLIFSSPSYSARSEIWGEKLSIISLLRNFILKFPTTTIAIVVYVMLPIVLFILGISYYLMKNKKKTANEIRVLSFVSVFVLAMLAFGFSSALCDYFPTRSWSPAIILILIPTVTLFSECKSEKTEKNLITDFCAIAVSLCLLVGSFISAYTDLRDTDIAFKEREEIIMTEKSNNNNVVELKQIKARTKYSEFSQTQGEISDGDWVNDVMARYYGIEKILVKHEK